MPAGFEFSLQPLLDRRERIEEERRRDLARCMNALERCAHEVESLARTQRRSLNELAQWARAAPADLRLRDRHLLALQTAIDTERRQYAQLEGACERARAALTAAGRERRTMEKLKERRHQAFSAAQTRREELELDDANARAHERRARERLVQRAAGRAAS